MTALRVAMVVSNDLAHDPRVLKEARSLAAAGHEVTVHGTLSPATVPEEPRDGFTIVRSPVPAWVDARGPHRTVWRSFRWFDRMQFLVDSAMARQPDVLHAHDLDTVGPAARAAVAAAIPFVFDDHEASYVDKLPNYVPADVRGPKRAALDAITRAVQRRGEALERDVRRQGPAGLVTVSESLADRLVARFGGPRPIVVRNIPEFREVARTEALRERIGASADERIVLYHGTATEGSGIEAAIAALALLGPGHVLVLLGRVWRQERYEAIAERSGVSARVRFLPMAPQDEMFRLVASADVGIIPTEPNSVGNLYGLPNKLFESMLAGLPVVASDVPEVASVVRATGAGVLYPAGMPQDPAALADAIRHLLSDRDLWQTCRANALRAAREEFNWERESRKLVSLYREIAAKAAPAGA